MADESTAPLLDRASRSRSPSLDRSSSPVKPPTSSPLSLLSESTPLLHRDDDLPRYGGEEQPRSSSPVSLKATYEAKSRPRWPLLLAIALLTLAAVAIVASGFVVPSVVKEYAQEAAVFTPREFSIESTTPIGVRARIKGDFVLDSSRVQKQPVRNIGRFVTGIARMVETSESEAQVYLPEYGNVLVGTASLPPVKLKIGDGQVNFVDILTDLRPGDVADLRRVANDWLEGRLGQLRVKGTVAFTLKSGLLSLGSQVLSDIVSVDDNTLPKLPAVNVTKLNVHEDKSTGKRMAVDVSVDVSNDYPFKLVVPPLGFDILVPNCLPGDPNILVANASTDIIEVQPKRPVTIDGYGLIHKLPAELTSICPGMDTSPLDLLVASYIQGLETIIYVRGADAPSRATPAWMVDLVKSVTVPVPITGDDFGHLIKNFSMMDTHFYLPDPLAEPGTPGSLPKISAVVNVLVNLPERMNFSVDIPRVRSFGDVYYQGNKFGFLDLREWQAANATRTNDTSNGNPLLKLQFNINRAPLQVTDDDILTEVIQKLIFGKKPVALSVNAVVDAEVETSLGKFVIRDIPAAGKVKVKPPFGGSIGDLQPKINSVKVWHTSQTTVILHASINFTNPTEYSATIPLVDVLLLYNRTALAHLTARDLVVVPGLNSDIRVEASWSPFDSSGELGVEAGRKLISQYVSGFNTTVTIQSHENSIPALPNLGRALSKLEIDVQVPRLRIPGDDNGQPGDDSRHFIKDATLHVWSSTAVFTLVSPLPETTLYITSVDAIALYNHTEPVGTINYSLPFAVPPGISHTPKLPVDLNYGVGFDALKRALGGTLRLDAKAKVGFRIGEYTTLISYQGKGIAAKVAI